jgi:hypothetical protein
MPAKLRVPKERRPAPFGAETLALFKELEAVPMRSRDTDGFRAKQRELMKALGLGDQWRFSSCSVLSRIVAPPHHEMMPAYHDWIEVRRVRLALLEAIKDPGDGVPARATRPD